MKGRSASKIKLTSYDELLGGGEEINDIQQVSLEHLHSFENHPFQVNDDEAMEELVESVKEEGILTALLVRPLGNGEYEIIAGHRRRHAAQLAGLKEVPVIIRNMDQDTAVRAMVDSNLQRPNILPSEKAFAYRMKMEAMNHQGTSGGISAKDIGKNGNDSARQVYRYIRLTYLMNDLLNAVDRDVIGLQVGVELSYLTVPEQEMVEEVHESTGKYPSLEQAKKIRQHREEKTLTKQINGEAVPTQVVKSRLLKVGYEHIQYVFFSLDRSTSKVKNIRQYMLTVLYNAPATINQFYDAEVRHDMYWGKDIPDG